MIHPSIVNGSDNFRVCVCFSFGTFTCSWDAQIVHCTAGGAALLDRCVTHLLIATGRSTLLLRPLGSYGVVGFRGRPVLQGA